MNNTFYGTLIFELSKKGRKGYSLPANEFKQYSIPAEISRQSPTMLPEADEQTVVRHYTNMSNNNFGVDTGFYPLGSCTMKYNPKINEENASHPAFQGLHPLAPACAVQGALEVYYNTQKILSELGGMSEFTLNPFAGAHGELTGLMVIRNYHMKRGDLKRTKIIIPDSAHGTNPASAAVCGLEVVEVKSTADGTVDVEDLKPLLNDEVAGMMMTNPNTLGIFETKIPEIAKLVHDCGGLMYYDGANLNPLLGVCRPGDMGFDVMHINLHKTFSTPHGGGGPGAGPIGVRAGLEAYLPNPQVKKADDGTFYVHYDKDSLGSISGFFGNYAVVLRAYTFLLSAGKEQFAKMGSLKSQHVTTLDVAKRLLDYGFHAPTIYFPLLFHEALMIEPTETESKDTIDAFIEVMRKIAKEAAEDPEMVKSAPHCTPITRCDDVKAVKEPKLTYKAYL